MTTLRKLPTIAPKANAKTLSRLKVASYAIAATRGNVTTRAFRNGGEWGLVASAVFKTVVSARKRRRVGSIPTRLRQCSGPRCVRQEPDLDRAAFVGCVHRLD